MATTNVTINRTSYTEVAAIGATGRITNLNEDDIYVFFKPTAPADADIGHLCVGISTDNNIFELNGNATDKAWARLANNSLSTTGTVSVTVGEAGGGSGSSSSSSSTSYQIYMLYNNIANIPAATNDVAGWATYMGTDAVTVVATSGNAVTLTCNHSFSLPDESFMDNTAILAFIDNGAITSTGKNAFKGCTVITDFVGDGITSTQAAFLKQCPLLKRVSIGRGKLVTLGDEALYLTESLVDIAANIEFLPRSFMECMGSSYTNSFFSNCTAASDYALVQCKAWEIVLPNCKFLGYSALKDLDAGVNRVVLPSCENFGQYALGSMNGNTHLYIPAAKNADTNAFSGTTGKTITVHTNQRFNSSSSAFLAFKAANTVTVVIVDDVAISQTTTSGDLTSTATTGTAQSCDGANTVQLTIKLGTATTPPSIQVQGTDDGTNWYNLGSPLAGVASSTVTASITGIIPKQVRWKVSSAGATIGAGWSIILRAN